MSFDRQGLIERRLSDIAEIHNSKRIPLNSRERQKRQGVYPYYGASGIVDYINDYIFDGEYVLISEDGENLRSRNTPIAFKADGKFWVNNHAHIVKGKQELFNDFIVYYFSNLNINAFVTGAVQPKLNKENLLNIPIWMPKDESRLKQMTLVLKSLDDKIELNRQMAQTLEAMAQALFKEMCLPKGMELPEGWTVGKLGEFYKTTSGGTPSRGKMEFYENGTINWVKSKELGNFFVLDTEEKITELALKSSSAKLLPVNSVMLAMYGATVGEISILGKPASSNQAICSILPNDNYPFSFIYELLKGKKEDIKHMAVGGAQQNISQAVIQGLEVVMPSPKVLKAFHKLVSPIYDAIKCGINETQTLTSLRDGLLPKLMKGEIEN